MSMPSAVRHINEIRAVRELFRGGLMSRADLARKLDLTRSTVGNIIAELVRRGTVVEVQDTDSGDGRIGRPGLHLKLRNEHACFVGVEIGVDSVCLVALDLMAKPIWGCRQSYGEDPNPLMVSRILNESLKLLDQERGISSGIEGICVTVPGLLEHSGRILSAPILGWSDLDLRAVIEESLNGGSKLLIENDANAFATAETFAVESDPSETAIFILIDAGVGAGLISNGKLVRGEHGFAGEVGHIPVGEHGYAARSATPGSWESYVGRDALVSRFRHYGGAETTLEDFLIRLKEGDRAAQAAQADWVRWLARGLAMLITTLDPARVVLGGSMAAIVAHSIADIQLALRPLMLKSRLLPSINVSQLGADAVAIGAACMLHRSYFSIDTNFVFGEGD